MTTSSRLFHQIADPALTHSERAHLRCRLAKQLADVGSYEAAQEAMGELWLGVGERPTLNGLDRTTTAEVLLRVGALTGWIGSVKQFEGSQETAKDLLTESQTVFETLQNPAKAAEAKSEIALCYWRQGRHADARIWLQEALGRLPSDSEIELRAVASLRLAIVEQTAKRFSDALKIHLKAAPLFEKISNHALNGTFHNSFGFVLRNLAVTEKRNDYIDRALIEYTAASYHFEQAGHARYQGCVENNIGYLFYTLKRYPEAHHHLDRAQALFTGMKDRVHTAQVDDTRARVLLAEGYVAEAERLVRSAVRVLEGGGEQSLLAEALTTQGRVLIRSGNHAAARSTLRRASEVAEGAGNSETAGEAALIIVEELAEHVPAQELAEMYARAAELLASSQNPDVRDRLLLVSRRVMNMIGTYAELPTWEGFNFYDAVLRFEAHLIERALREAGGVVARAAQLLGIERRSLDAMLHKGRHRTLSRLRAPAEPRRSSLMFRDDQNCPDTRTVTVLHVEGEAAVAEAVRMRLDEEGWSVEACGDGRAALERMEGGGRYDVLVVADQLPDMSGVELVCSVRLLAHRQRTPVVVLAGDGEVELRARQAGANAFLRKPDNILLLAETVARLLARRWRQR